MVLTFARRHPTGLTIAAFFAVSIGLSLSPVPSWMKPTELFDAEDPVAAFQEALFSQPEAIPLPDQQVDQEQATGDPLLLDENPDAEDPVAEVPVSPVVPKPSLAEGERTKWVKPARPAFERYAPRLGLEAAPLIRPCLDDSCDTKALDGFFRVLEGVEAGRRSGRVVHFGDSLIASDKIADRVRQRMQERFGSAGRGFLMGKRFNQFQRGNRSGRGSRGWDLEVITVSLKKLERRNFGFAGAAFTAKRAGETLRFAPVGGSRILDVYYTAQPSGGRLQILADETVTAELDTAAKGVNTGTVARYALPKGTETVTLKSVDKGARVYGVSLDSDQPGLTWTTLGLPGATSEVWLRPDGTEFEAQLEHLSPDLAVVMLGGNDGLMLSKKRTTAAAIERDTRAFLARIRAARPGLDCLLVTPLESVRAKTGGRLIPKPEVLVVIDVLRRVAESEGCGFWDMYASMGGKGSLKRWVKAKLMLGDLIHPRSRGSDLLGEMMVEALMTAYDERGGGA